MKKDLESHSDSSAKSKEEMLKLIAKRYGVAIVEAEKWLKYDGELAVWRSNASKLVTCLCMGGKFYAKEITAIPPREGTKPEPREYLTADGEIRTANVIPVAYTKSEAERAVLAARADEARLELANQVALPPERWPQVADRVMQRGDLLSWLVIQKLLPAKPTAPYREPAEAR